MEGKQMITIKMELDFEDLQKQCWSGAINTLNKIEEACGRR